uniref:Src homology 2 domain containing transforming protein D n=1 Tax=Terrapene triunguis TaxID=2587831 RepID=A0A674KHW7_9SAUR
MAKWLKDYLSFGSRRSPPQPPKPDYTESEILKAYRAQKSLDFEDPYEDSDNKLEPDPGGSGSPNTAAAGGCAEGKYTSPKHRLIKVESKALLATAAEELKGGEYSDPFDARREQPGDAEETVPENNGYMEPYDAQRVVAGERHQDCGPTRSSLLPLPPRVTHFPPTQARCWPPERSPPVAERVDPSLPLEKQVSSQGFMHMKFTRTRESKYVLGQNSAPFESIPEVIHYYTVRELPVKGAEQLSLLYPVAVQTL